MTSDPRLPALQAALDRKQSQFAYFPTGPRFNLRQSDAFFVSLLPHLSRGQRVLDVGCGRDDGWRSVLEAFAIDWWGVDVFEATGRDRYARVVDDRIPHDASAFDAVALLDVLEHFVRPETMMAEIARVLRPGGLLFGTSAFWQFEHDSYVHYTLKGVRALLERYGFEVEAIWPSVHSGLLQTAQRFFGDGRVLRGHGKRAFVRSILRGAMNLPIFAAASALEEVRKRSFFSQYQGRDDVDCAGVYFIARKLQEAR